MGRGGEGSAAPVVWLAFARSLMLCKLLSDALEKMSLTPMEMSASRARACFWANRKLDSVHREYSLSYSFIITIIITIIS